MRIAYILESFPSPTEYFILNEILQFENNGFKIQLLVLKRQKRYADIPELKNLKATIYYLPRFHFYFPLIPILLSPFSLFRIVFAFFPISFFDFFKNLRYYGISLYFTQKKIRCDHIHSHFAFITVDIALCLSKLLKVNYSCTVHAKDIYTNQQKIKQHLPSAKFLITCTEYNKNYLNQLTSNKFKDKIHRVYHGIKLEKWPQIIPRTNMNKELQVLSIARLIEKKGLIYLIKATERLIYDGINVHCTIIGEGLLQSVLVKYINAKYLNNLIEIIPFIPQNKLKTYFSLADVFVLPCIISSNGDRDGLPNVIVEAMLLGVPVISTPVSDIPEVIQHKETGILVKEKDEQAIVDGIKLLANDRNLQQHIIKNARRLVEDKLAIASSTRDLIEIFKKSY